MKATKKKKTVSKKVATKSKKPTVKTKALLAKSKGKGVKIPSLKMAESAVKAFVKGVKTKPQRPAARMSARPSGIPEHMRDAAMKILDERQAEEIVSFDLAGKSSVADYLIVASGRSSRQVGAIAHYLQEAFKKLGGGRVRVEGLPEANWVLVDGGDVIVHLFLPEVLGYYDLEGIWTKRT